MAGTAFSFQNDYRGREGDGKVSAQTATSFLNLEQQQTLPGRYTKHKGKAQF